MPIFDRKVAKSKCFEDLLQKSLKIHNELTEGNKVDYFHYFMPGDAQQTFKTHQPGQREFVRSFDCVP